MGCAVGAALLVGWAAALRRSELAALDVNDVAYEREGMVLAIRRSKTDPEAAGDAVATPWRCRTERKERRAPCGRCSDGWKRL